MAARTVVTLVDDLDGTDADLTIPFALEGVSYEIDLSLDNAEAMREALEPYVAAARRTGGRKVAPRPAPAVSAAAPAASTKGKRSPAQTRAIRQWAGENGFEVSSHGRIPATVVEAYEEALAG